MDRSGWILLDFEQCRRLSTWQLLFSFIIFPQGSICSFCQSSCECLCTPFWPWPYFLWIIYWHPWGQVHHGSGFSWCSSQEGYLLRKMAYSWFRGLSVGHLRWWLHRILKASSTYLLGSFKVDRICIEIWDEKVQKLMFWLWYDLFFSWVRQHPLLFLP